MLNKIKIFYKKTIKQGKLGLLSGTLFTFFASLAATLIIIALGMKESGDLSAHGMVILTFVGILILSSIMISYFILKSVGMFKFASAVSTSHTANKSVVKTSKKLINEDNKLKEAKEDVNTILR